MSGEGPDADGYAPDEVERPLGGYALLIGVFDGLLVTAITVLGRSDRELPERVGAQDIVVLGTATHKVSRLLAKEKVTSVVRAPFTRLEGRGAPGELEERPRGRGLRFAIGELLNCPFCLSQWIASAFALGLAVAPRPTRLIASIFTMTTIADFLQLAYRSLDRGEAPARRASPQPRSEGT